MYFCVLGDSDVKQFIENEHYNGTYKGFAPYFTAELFDPDTWAELFAKAGAKFVKLFLTIFNTSPYFKGYNTLIFTRIVV